MGKNLRHEVNLLIIQITLNSTHHQSTGKTYFYDYDLYINFDGRNFPNQSTPFTGTVKRI